MASKSKNLKIQSHFYSHCLLEWNKLDLEFRASPSVSIVKKKLAAQVGSPVNSVLGSHDQKWSGIFFPYPHKTYNILMNKLQFKTIVQVA